MNGMCAKQRPVARIPTNATKCGGVVVLEVNVSGMRIQNRTSMQTRKRKVDIEPDKPRSSIRSTNEEGDYKRWYPD